jgi:hypothetical protein
MVFRTGGGATHSALGGLKITSGAICKHPTMSSLLTFTDCASGAKLAPAGVEIVCAAWMVSRLRLAVARFTYFTSVRGFDDLQPASRNTTGSAYDLPADAAAATRAA